MQEPKNNLKEHPDLYKRSIKGGYWVFAIRFVTQLMGFVKSIIVFNFLFSENLELIIVANLLIAVLKTFSESGFRAALIQKKENIADYLDTAWVIGILRGILLFAVIYFAAPLFASFRVAVEDVPLAISVIRAMGVCLLIGSFQNIGTVYFRKELEFHKTFWLGMAGTLTDIFLSISLVLIYQSVWAYVIARLASSVVNLGMGYWLCSYRPKFHFVPEKARELWKFGKWLFKTNIAGYLISEGDDWFVWFYLGGGPLKLYRYAFHFAIIPATHITSVISGVTFPAYSKIQDDLSRLREAYLKVLQITALISVPTAFLIFTLGPDFVKLFLVEESYAMIPIFQILALKGLMSSINSTYGALFKAVGKPQIIWHTTILCLVVLGLIIYPFTKMWGIYGTAIATVLMGVIVNPYYFLQLLKILHTSAWSVIRILLLPLSASVIMAAALEIFGVFIFKQTTFISFTFLGIISVLIYLSVLWILDSIFDSGIRKLVVDQFTLIKSRVDSYRKPPKSHNLKQFE